MERMSGAIVKIIYKSGVYRRGETETTANEESRLIYRYVDLRRPVMQRTLRLRHRLANAARAVLDGRGFVEIEPPMLTRSPPEGARDYLVPSRVHPGRVAERHRGAVPVASLRGFVRRKGLSRAVVRGGRASDGARDVRGLGRAAASRAAAPLPSRRGPGRPRPSDSLQRSSCPARNGKRWM